MIFSFGGGPQLELIGFVECAQTELSEEEGLGMVNEWVNLG